MKLSRHERETLKAKYGSRCAYCGSVLDGKWHADHTMPVRRDTRYCAEKRRYVTTGAQIFPERDVLENLVPACAPCNIYKAGTDLESWRRWLQGRLVASLRENHPIFRHGERFGLLTVAEPKPLVFWFEKYAQPDDKVA